jgi:hypothetical protein
VIDKEKLVAALVAELPDTVVDVAACEMAIRQAIDDGLVFVGDEFVEVAVVPGWGGYVKRSLVESV